MFLNMYVETDIGSFCDLWCSEFYANDFFYHVSSSSEKIMYPGFMNTLLGIERHRVL